MSCLLALLLAAAPAEERLDHGPHFAIAAGSGIAFGTAGAHLELLYGHLAAFAGIDYACDVRKVYPDIDFALGFEF